MKIIKSFFSKNVLSTPSHDKNEVQVGLIIIHCNEW